MRGKMPSIVSPGTYCESSHNSAIFTIEPNSPKLMSTRGSATILIIGYRNVWNNARVRPIPNSINKLPENVKPSTSSLAIYIAAEFTTAFKRNLNI